MKDFFISYSKADQAVAEWVGWVLEEEGYSVVLQSWDFLPGDNFILKMHEAAAGSRSTVALLSADYLASDYARQELAAALASDPQGRGRRLIPIRVGEFEPHGLLGPIVYADIVGLPEEEARGVILRALSGRGKPDAPPSFPQPQPPPRPAARAPHSTGVSHTTSAGPSMTVRPTRRLSCTITFALIGVVCLGLSVLSWYLLAGTEAQRATRLASSAGEDFRPVAPVVESTAQKGALLSKRLNPNAQAASTDNLASEKEFIRQTVSDIDQVLPKGRSACDKLSRASEYNVIPELKEYISLKLQATCGTYVALLTYRNALAEIRADLDAPDVRDWTALARAGEKLRAANEAYVAATKAADALEHQAAEVAARFPDKIQVTRPD